MAAFVPIIMVLGRIAVKVGSETVKKYLKKNGFRIAKDYKKYARPITQKDLPNLLSQIKPGAGRAGPKTGGGSLMTTAGGRGQSALGRRIALSKMKNYGKVGPKSTSIPKKPPKKPIETPVEPTIQLPKSAITPVAKRIVQGLNIAAAGGIAKVAYDAFKDDEIKKLDLEVYRKNSGVLNANVKKAIDKVLEADRIEALKDPRLKKAGNDIRGLSGRPTYKKRTPKQEAQIANTPARRKAIERAVREALAFKIPNKNKGK